MEAEGAFPNLGAVSCSQLTFGADIKLSASQVGAIRDSVLARFPSSSIPPWYFGEIYRWDEDTYEVAASISASNKLDPLKAYSAFFRIQKLGDGSIDGPPVKDLLKMLSPQDKSLIFCTAHFIRRDEDGEPYASFDAEIYRDDHGKIVVESYMAGIYDDSNARLGSTEVRRFNDGTTLYSISFSHEGAFVVDFASTLLSSAVSLFKRVYRGSQEGVDAGH